MRAVLTTILLLGTNLTTAVAADGDDFFEANVRPVLIEQCQQCHGPKKQRGGLRLDSRDALLKGGDTGPSIVTGPPEKSLLIQAIRRTGDLKMPPEKPLTDKQIEALTKWVALGTPWPADRHATEKPAAIHWAFQPVRPVALPAVKSEAWVKSPIDRFVLAKLDAEGLTPSPTADRRTLIRRMTYDITGLPPTPEEVVAFAQDTSPNAIAKLVDRLLASPHYGEQWGRHWLDVARYSDTKGYVYGREERFWVHAWVYRDWVVKALNNDMPYDQFVKLQLAADQVAANDPTAQAAMGFLTLNRRFLGVRHDIIDDRIDTVTRGLLGLTVACARCHNHKYDPIPTDDYYSLYGVFRNSAERIVPASTTIGDEAFRKGLLERQKKLTDMTALRRSEAAQRARNRTVDYLLAQLELDKYPEEGFDQILAPTDVIPTQVRKWRDYLARCAKQGDPVFALWRAYAKLKLAEFKTADLSQQLKASHRLVAQAFRAPPKDITDVARRYARLFTQVETQRDPRFAAILGTVALPLHAAKSADIESLYQILHTEDSPANIPNEPIVETENDYPSNVVNELWKLQNDVDKWILQSNARFATVLVDRSQPVNARVFRRGNPATPTNEVPRRFLQVLAGPDCEPFRNGSGRLELANAIASPANPLTARVIVNRVWMHHFGTGLVTTPSDFGVRADPPSHPELLDWLASQFVANGWSLKKLHREILLSAAYQQAATGPADAAKRSLAVTRDPANRFLWRTTARRLSFEEMRDSLFAVGGQLDGTIGGKPFDMLNRKTPARRSLYGLVDRQFPLDVLRVFDFANPDLHVPQRSETTVPQQALFLLNHPLPIDRAKAVADHPTIAKAATPGAKVKALYRLLFQREPTANQLRAAVSLIETLEAEDVTPTPSKPNAWSYGVAAFEPKLGKIVGFTPLPHFNGTAWQGGENWPDTKFGWAQLTATGGHPGNDLAHAVVRRWTAPRDATVRIESLLQHQDQPGDGVRATIISSRDGVLKTATAHQSEVVMTVNTVDVKVGDTIDFVVDILKVLNTDQYIWSPTIHEIRDDKNAPTWDAKAEFAGPPRQTLRPWEQLAQALLMTNEFFFVD